VGLKRDRTEVSDPESIGIRLRKGYVVAELVFYESGRVDRRHDEGSEFTFRGFMDDCVTLERLGFVLDLCRITLEPAPRKKGHMWFTKDGPRWVDL